MKRRYTNTHKEIRTLVLVLLLVWVCPLFSQSSDADEEAFESIRSGFYGEVLNRSKLLTEQYRNALSRLEIAAAEEGSYDLALRLRDRQNELDQVYSSTDSSLAQNLATPLLGDGAKMTGVTSPDIGVFSGWRASSSFVEWRNVPINSGEYYLELDYLMLDAPIASSSAGMAAERQAVFDFFEVSLLAGASSNRRSFELQSSKDGSSYTSLKVGPIRYERIPVTLRLTPSKGYPGNVIWIRNMRLVPYQEAISEVDSNSSQQDFPRMLEDLKKHFTGELLSARQQAASTHIAALKSLRTGNPDWKESIDAEIQQTEKIQRDKTPILPRPLASLGGIAGFQDIPEATFLPRPDNMGDQFWVKTADDEMRIKLLWINCAPNDGSDASRFSEHFKIAPDDAVLFGRAAAEFTAGYLEGKTLRLLVRNQPAPDGSLPALVFLPDLGLYQNHLVDQGLAAVTGERHPNRSTLERALLNALVSRETDSRTRNPRPGAWALSSISQEP